ncbi:DUF3592 domain-containing protein [Streptomyces sp. NBC_01351]|uniref:DUF3592 domain-containing protein n=1 Tax=Streptomyces sp. NBC_01351 TaxID=2903833 RepID=UPI002E332599|nr:DUF3592 domain-containing protein [Streptomyces sp. NBC_01351]
MTLLITMSVLVGLLIFGISLGIYVHSSPLLKRGVRTSAVCVNVGQVAAGSMLLLEYTPQGGPARQYTVGPFVFPPVRVGGRLDVIYDPKRPQEVSLPERLPKSTRGLVISMAVSGAVLAACAVRIVVAVQG